MVMLNVIKYHLLSRILFSSFCHGAPSSIWTVLDCDKEPALDADGRVRIRLAVRELDDDLRTEVGLSSLATDPFGLGEPSYKTFTFLDFCEYSTLMTSCSSGRMASVKPGIAKNSINAF